MSDLDEMEDLCALYKGRPCRDGRNNNRFRTTPRGANTLKKRLNLSSARRAKPVVTLSRIVSRETSEPQ
jgi:hypothetical protein